MICQIHPGAVAGRRRFLRRNRRPYVASAPCLTLHPTLAGVDRDADRRQQVNEGHLARGEDGARSHRELAMASLALELAAGRDLVGLAAAAIRANRLALTRTHRMLRLRTCSRLS
jgi:hypothetical protein